LKKRSAAHYVESFEYRFPARAIFNIWLTAVWVSRFDAI
jgi:hypothetical protein